MRRAIHAQAAVDAEGSALVLSARVSVCANDTGEREAGPRAIPTEAARVRAVLVDRRDMAMAKRSRLCRRRESKSTVPCGPKLGNAAGGTSSRPPIVDGRSPWRRKRVEKLASPEGRRLHTQGKQAVD
ncbi:hypothetical protein [Methylacidimicrobium sp. AP8]|uniref:hypothetical protein n=1 Tax=Methylacidimicrobium sp. AP8 TaxID=2730359 RepID=UPI0019225D4A|nr:hypothetical protein [Methylacidimicrobium sp. AP8]